MTTDSEDTRQRKLAQYLAENFGHELTLALRSFTEQVPGAFQPESMVGVESALRDVADSIRYLADAIRVNPDRSVK
jgi:hypothetical protein